MLAPCITCNSFYFITTSFLSCFLLSSPFPPSSLQIENSSIQKLFLLWLSKVLKRNWESCTIAITAVLFSPSSNTRTTEHQAEWRACDESHLMPRNTHGRRGGQSVISPTQGWQDMKQCKGKLEDLNCQVLHHVGHYEGPLSPFLVIKTQVQTILNSALQQNCSCTSADTWRASFLSSSRGPAVKHFIPNAFLPFGVGTWPQGSLRQNPDGFSIYAQCDLKLLLNA